MLQSFFLAAESRGWRCSSSVCCNNARPPLLPTPVRGIRSTIDRSPIPCANILVKPSRAFKLGKRNFHTRYVPKTYRLVKFFGVQKSFDRSITFLKSQNAMLSSNRAVSSNMPACFPHCQHPKTLIPCRQNFSLYGT